MIKEKTQLIIIGAGPGGYTAAIKAAELGLEVILIEKNQIGGVCTNVGCIPTKALLHAADVKHEAESESAKNMGLNVKVKIDIEKTIEWKNKVVLDLRSSIEKQCISNKIKIIKGNAKFTSSNSVEVKMKSKIIEIEFEKAILATGSKTKELKQIPFDHKSILNSTDALNITDLPKKIIVVGGGYIAVEMANTFMKFGSKVIIVHRGNRLLRNLEPEVSMLLMKKIHEFGAEVLFESEILSIKNKTAKIKTAMGIKHLNFDKMIVAVGREPDFSDLGIEKTKIEITEEGLIKVDNQLKTTDPNIFAIGDIVRGPQLAHKAFREGKIAAEVASGINSKYENISMPMVIFSDPEIASVGLTESEAAEKGIKVTIGRMPFSSLGKARAINRTEGFVKIIADEKGKVLGAHIVGVGAGSLIAEASLALEIGATVKDLSATIHAHPTLPEALSEAAENALKNILNRNK